MSADSTPQPDHSSALVVGAVGRTSERLHTTLAHLGLGAEFASDGTQAVAAARTETPSIVLLCTLNRDGELDAAQTCEALRELEGWGETPILVGVRANDEALFERVFEAGATDVYDTSASDEFVARRLAILLRASTRRASGARSSDSEESASGLPGGHAFEARVQRAMNHALVDGSCIAAMCLDVENFKEATAGLGPEGAEQLLRGVATRLRDVLRETDTVQDTLETPTTSFARVADGQFSILLEGLESPEGAAKVGQRLMDLLSDPLEFQGEELSLFTNIGIAAYPSQVQGSAELLARARKAMMRAREEGGNTQRFFDSDLNAKAFERLTLEANLRRALEREELVVYYQPRVEVSTGRLLSFEALVRWQHPELGLVSPAQFIPLAEETGLIVPIGEWVLQTACRQNRAWQNEGLPPVSVSVNLSSVQFRKPGLYETVVRVLGESGLDPSWLELELTESLLMQNADSVIDTLKRFRSAGIHLSIDDFGTGYSSLSYLRRFPIDALKIDRSFIREVTTNSDDAALATSIILMGRSLKLRVIAEGVETESQLSFLRIMQCDEVQGFLYSRPVPAEEATAMLKNGLLRAGAA